MGMTFYAVANNAGTTTPGYTAAAGTIAVATGAGALFGSTFPIVISTFLADGTPKGVYACSGRSADTLTGLALLSGTDATLPTGSLVKACWTAENVREITAALSPLAGAGVSLWAGAHAESESIALGESAHSEGSSTATNAKCHAEGTRTVAGYNPVACTIAGHVVTVPGVDVTGDFYDGGPVALIAMTGGTGATAVAATVSGDPTFGADTQITLVETLSHTSGKIAPTDSTSGSHSEGQDTIASGWNAHAQGNGTIASATDSFAGGHGSRATAIVATALGKESMAHLRSQFALASGKFATVGDAQISSLVVLGLTGQTTPVVLSLDRTSGLVVPSGVTWAFALTIVARQDDGTSALFRRSGLVANVAGTTALVGSVETVGTDINGDGWAVAVTAVDADDSLAIAVTGAADTNIRWVARVELVEVAS